MNLRKISATVLIAAIAALLLSVAFEVSMARADDKESHPTPTAGSTLPPRPHREDHDSKSEHESKSEHDQLREQYGDDEIDKVFLPPLVVSDPAAQIKVNGSGQKAPVLPAKPGADSLVDATNVNPHANAPIDVKTIKATRQTPAESFFEMATIALVAMAAGSAALGGVAIRRAIKLRNTPNADFIYE